MEIKDVLFFDTETTGIPERSAKWDVDFNDYPHIVQLAWKIGDKEESHIISPCGWEIPEEAVSVHGITTEYARMHGEPFVFVIDRFIAFALEAGLLCGHNIHFDTSIIKANILRELGWGYYNINDVENALYKGKRIDTMRPTMKWVDARMANGRLKFPNLTELFSRCFPGETFPAHEALSDVKAVARCLPVIVDLGLVELKVKEYPKEDGDLTEPMKKAEQCFKELGNAGSVTAETLQKAERIAADAAKKFGIDKSNGNGPNLGDNNENDKLPIQSEKAPEIENFEKISDVAAELLDENDF